MGLGVLSLEGGVTITSLDCLRGCLVTGEVLPDLALLRVTGIGSEEDKSCLS